MTLNEVKEFFEKLGAEVCVYEGQYTIYGRESVMTPYEKLEILFGVIGVVVFIFGLPWLVGIVGAAMGVN